MAFVVLELLDVVTMVPNRATQTPRRAKFVVLLLEGVFECRTTQDITENTDRTTEDPGN